MNNYLVLYDAGDFEGVFKCQADNAEHALEQAFGANPGEQITAVYVETHTPVGKVEDG